MDHAIRTVQDIVAKHPENLAARDALLRLQEYRHFPTGQDPQKSWGVAQGVFASLQAEGLWDKSGENESFLQQIQAELRAADASDAQQAAPEMAAPDFTSSNHRHEVVAAEPPAKISIVSPPSISSFPLQLLSTTTLLPAELLDVLAHAYFLHVLATDAEKVLPPGKSLLSVMSNPNSLTADSDAPTLQSRVEDLVHKAFWDEVSF